MKKSNELKSLAHLWPYQGDLNGINLSSPRIPVIARVMARMDLAGGWGDSPYVFTKRPASILAASMSFGAASGQHAITAVVNPAPVFRFSVDDVIQDVPELLVYTLGYLGFAKESQYPPISITLYNVIPRGSGLGGSGLVITVTLAAIFAYYRGIEYPQDNLLRLIEYPIAIEQLQGTRGSWNDTVPGLLPGIKLIQTHPSNIHEFKVTGIPQKIADELAQRCVLVDLQHTRRAAPFCHSIQTGFVQGDAGVIRMLDKIDMYAQEMFNVLLARDFVAFGQMMRESWQAVCEVEMNSTLPIVGEVESLLSKELCGLKIGGAGGGGFAILVARSPQSRDIAVMKLSKAFPDSEHTKQIRLYAPQFPPMGLHVGYLNPNSIASFGDQLTSTTIK